MKLSLSNSRPFALRNSSPPRLPVRADSASSISLETDNVDVLRAAKDVEKVAGLGSKAPLLGVLAAVSLLSGVAGPALAQVPPGVAPLVEQSIEQLAPSQLDYSSLTADTIDLRKESADPGLRQVHSDSTKTELGVQVNSVNDFIPNSWTSWLGGPEHKVPDGRAFDDDGWTAEVQLETNIRRGNEEWVVGGRLAMLTELGSREPFGPNYTGKRADLGELVVQRNVRRSLGENTILDYGVGGGLQAAGKLGGEGLQTWWHEAGPTGGRVGDDLQSNYTSQSFRVMPLVTGGARLTHSLNSQWDVKLGSQVSVPLGRGLGNVGFRAGVATQVGPVNFELGGKLDATWSEAPEFAFQDPTGIREGLYGRIEYEPGRWGGIYTQLETGGLRNEPVLSIGIRIGGGTRSRLSPFW